MDVVMYVPPGMDAMRWRQDCRDYCTRHEYRPVAVAHRPEDVEAMWRRGQISRIVVARPEHARALAYAVEVVSEEVTRRAPRQRRTGRREAGYRE